ncbi:MAG TPA: hypothetical protein PKD51_20860 [Saprospiraceae bacterium]|nr:hypothetical protein [Saprospiraceae bacterium]HMU04653.1 hypothetical protein [Saprospiraceae bacterium]
MRKLTLDQFHYLENIYLKYFPINIPDEILNNYKAIIEYKNVIKYAKRDKRTLNCLLDVVINKINLNQRFQKGTLIKLIRWQSDKTLVDPVISDKLFYIFKSLITNINEEISWSLSVTIKDIELSEENIEWLVHNYDKSIHIQNRLLLYPKPNKIITEWANKRLKQGDLDNRKSELIGLKLNYNSNFSIKNKESLLWAIHYSKLNVERKKELLLKHTNSDSFEELIKICEKNKFIDIIERIYNEICNGSPE